MSRQLDFLLTNEQQRTTFGRKNLMKIRSKSLLAGLVVLAASSGISAQAATWSNDSANASWIVGTNWTSPATFPSGQDAVANLTNNITTNRTINLNQAITLGTLTWGDTTAEGSPTPTSKSYTIATGTGTNTLTFDVASGNATISKASPAGNVSNLTISANVALLDPLVVTLDSNGGSATISGIISGSGSITRQGSDAGPDGIAGGRLSLNGVNTYSGDTIVNGGRLDEQFWNNPFWSW